MYSNYIFRRLNAKEAEEGNIKTIDSNNDCSRNEVISMHSRKGSNKAISLTSSIRIACSTEQKYGPTPSHIAIIDINKLSKDCLYDISTVYLFEYYCKYETPRLGFEIYKPISGTTALFSKAVKEYLYFDNIPDKSYIIKTFKELSELQEITSECESSINEIIIKTNSQRNRIIDLICDNDEDYEKYIQDKQYYKQKEFIKNISETLWYLIKDS